MAGDDPPTTSSSRQAASMPARPASSAPSWPLRRYKAHWPRRRQWSAAPAANAKLALLRTASIASKKLEMAREKKRLLYHNRGEAALPRNWRGIAKQSSSFAARLAKACPAKAKKPRPAKIMRNMYAAGLLQWPSRNGRSLRRAQIIM